MAFELKNTVPWGRSLDEYTNLFCLTTTDLESKIISFGDGPASFNSEMNKLNKKVISIDPIYQFTKNEIAERIEETKEIVLQQTAENQSNFVWKNIKDLQHLEIIRTEAMSEFLNDFENGKANGRYEYHELPNITKFDNHEFDLGLSSHFLVLYSQLGVEFHIQSITEMLRICKEIRIFPLLNLDAEKSEVLQPIIDHFKQDYCVEIKPVAYEFQKTGNKMLVIKC